ncbi:MAG: Gfo/Idh/MocA family oxidoreductase [Planctomycetota bacterium]
MKKRPASQRRRDFLKTGALVAAGAAWPGTTAAASTQRRPRLPASERVNVAIVGIGGKGVNNRQMLQRTGMCNVVALCDVDLVSDRTRGARIANGDLEPDAGEDPSKHVLIRPKAPVFKDFRVMFDQMAGQIDAVVISTPDHTHFPIAMASMALGKHIWVEKPLARTFGECQRLMEMAKRSGVVTQVGNQGHSSANLTQFKAWTEAGVIKDVTRIDAYMTRGRRWHGWGEAVTEYPSEPMPGGLDWETWTGPAAMHPFSKKLHPANWRCWFDYGCGAMGDWGPHILDTCHRFLDLGLPTAVTAEKWEGANKLVYPQASTLRFDFPERRGMPACAVRWFDGRGNNPVIGPGLREDAIDLTRPGKIIYGKDRVFHGYSHSSTLNLVSDAADETQLPGYEEDVPNHWQNFLLACKGEAEANAPIRVAGPLTQALCLGMLCQRFGGTLEFDDKTGQIINHDQANALLDPLPRKGWEQYYKL